MVNILQLITSIDLGGAENVAFNIVEYSQKQYPGKFNFVIAELFSQKKQFSLQKKEELMTKNIPYISLYHGQKRISLLVAPFRLMTYIKKHNLDIIHSHTDLPDFVLATTLRLLSLFRIRKPRIVRTIHNTQLWAEHRFIGKYTEKIYINDCIVAVSEASMTAYNNLRKKYSLPTSIYQHTVLNGCPVPSKKEHELRIDRKRINIAFCGRFEYQKGIDVLIDIIREVDQKWGNTFLFHVIGQGTYKNKLIELLKCTDCLILYDAIPGMSEKFHAFDFLIMPSRFEGLVLTSIEASLSKVPVIASFAVGLEETLPKDWPLKFHLECTNEILTIFENIVNQKYDLVSLKEEVFAFAYKMFSVETMVKKYSMIYQT